MKYPRMHACLHLIVHGPEWSSMHTPHPPPEQYETYFILFPGPLQTWNGDATISKLGCTTHVTSFSKWPPAKSAKSHFHIVTWSGCLHICFQCPAIQWWHLYMHLGLLIALPCDVIFKMAAREITFSCITQFLKHTERWSWCLHIFFQCQAI